MKNLRTRKRTVNQHKNDEPSINLINIIVYTLLIVIVLSEAITVNAMKNYLVCKYPQYFLFVLKIVHYNIVSNYIMAPMFFVIFL